MATIEENETRDEIIAELRKTKDLLAAAHGYDVQRILDEAREKQQQSQRPLVRPKPPRISED